MQFWITSLRSQALRAVRAGGALAALLGCLIAVAAASAQAISLPNTPKDNAGRQTADQSLAQDGAEYARQFGVSLDNARQRLRAQEESVAATDGIGKRYRDRLAGISVEHSPAFRIVVYLTGTIPVPDEHVAAGGLDVPIVFRTGAKATRDRVIWAITNHQGEIGALFPTLPAMGLDPRSGELVIIVNQAVAAADVEALRGKIAALAGVPTRIRTLERSDINLTMAGGARVEGLDTADGKRYVCTTAFNVTDGDRFGITTAAHCLNDLAYHDASAGDEPLTYAGQWGWGYQDVQINLADTALTPDFYADTAKTLTRPVTAQRSRDDTRAGDFVCHRGERTGYSCALVELTDFAPAGALCGGPCLPTWVTVAGPNCKGGDSGSPVFSGTVALGILKGGSYRRDGSCAFYFYMSVDYLPRGWSLLKEPASLALATPTPGAP
ncbi:MAG: hypothetical protein ABIS14_04945 [Sphingomonas sp.]